MCEGLQSLFWERRTWTPSANPANTAQVSEDTSTLHLPAVCKTGRGRGRSGVSGNGRVQCPPPAIPNAQEHLRKTDMGEMTDPIDQSHLTPRPVRPVSYRRQQIFTPEGLTLLPDKHPDFRARTGRACPVALPPGTSTTLLHAETKPRATKPNKPQVGAPNPGPPKLSGGSATPAL